MDLLAFKLVVTPLLLLAASLAVRRWGEAVGGFVVGLPLTSGPISLFLALERGPGFAAQATSGSLTATAAQAGFGLAYCALAKRGWLPALAGACAAFVAVAWPLQGSGWSPGVLFIVALGAMAVSLKLSPRSVAGRGTSALAWWDLPVRMALIVGLVIGVTAAAPAMGPQASGVLASFPFMGIILTVFAHRVSGPGAAQSVMRGMVAGLLGFAVFFHALSLMLERSTLVVAYGGAVAAALATQGLLLVRLRSRTGSRIGQPVAEQELRASSAP